MSSVSISESSDPKSNTIVNSFFQEVLRIVAPDYLPNEMDVLRARTKTTGIYETRFQMGQLSIQCVYTYPFSQSNVNADFRIVCLMSVGNEAKERSGFTASRTLRQLFSASLSPNMTKFSSRRAARLADVNLLGITSF